MNIKKIVGLKLELKAVNQSIDMWRVIEQQQYTQKTQYIKKGVLAFECHLCEHVVAGASTREVGLSMIDSRNCVEVCPVAKRGFWGGDHISCMAYGSPYLRWVKIINNINPDLEYAAVQAYKVVRALAKTREAIIHEINNLESEDRSYISEEKDPEIRKFKYMLQGAIASQLMWQWIADNTTEDFCPGKEEYYDAFGLTPDPKVDYTHCQYCYCCRSKHVALKDFDLVTCDDICAGTFVSLWPKGSMGCVADEGSIYNQWSCSRAAHMDSKLIKQRARDMADGFKEAISRIDEAISEIIGRKIRESVEKSLKLKKVIPSKSPRVVGKLILVDRDSSSCVTDCSVCHLRHAAPACAVVDCFGGHIEVMKD